MKYFIGYVRNYIILYKECNLPGCLELNDVSMEMNFDAVTTTS